ncbi:MAG: Gfo/Idh/MocA family oxidoreductase [Sedimentisphaerales bacterium]|nr:Gfo/Idh/MocA family oxidoreductase [Sedimentisphaerales bacterium]
MSSVNKKLNTAVIGAGKMGQIHAKVYYQLPQSNLVAVVDTDAKKAKQLAKKFKCSYFTDLSEIIDRVDAVTIATPTIAHKETAEPFIERGKGVLIEKPLALNVTEAQELVSLAEKHNAIVAVGHSERCNPVVQAMKRLNIEAKFIEAHRISPYPFRSTDIGVVMDVMIHDIDIILSLAGSEIKKVNAVGIGVIDKDKEDICNARIVFENGCIANVTASRIALKTERKVRVFSKQAYLSLDYFKKTGTIIQADTDNLELIQKIRDLKSVGKFDLLKAGWSDLVHYERLQIDDKEPLRVEQESFLKAVADRTAKPEVTVSEGLAAMKCAQMILDSTKEHKWE